MQIPDLLKLFKNIPELKLDKSKRKILLIYGLSALFIFVGYFSLFFRPSVAKIAELNPEIRELKIAIKSIEDELQRGPKLSERLKAVKAKLGSYEKRLSREKELPVLLENLSGMAEKSQVKILSITPHDTGRKTRRGIDEEESVYQEIPIAITAQSGYHELGSFINRLENDQRYMQISHIKINPDQGDSEKHKVEFVVYAYTFKQ